MRIPIAIFLSATLLFAADPIITNIAKWNHPAKKVFIQNGSPVTSIQLLKNKTYPVFSVKGEVKNTPTFWMDVAKANGFWSFSVIDQMGMLYKITADSKVKKTPKIKRISPLNYNESAKTSLGTVTVHEADDYSGYYIALNGKRWKQERNLFYGTPRIHVVKDQSGTILLLVTYEVTGCHFPVSEYQLVELNGSGCHFSPKFCYSSELYTINEQSNHQWIVECVEQFVSGTANDGEYLFSRCYAEYTVTDNSVWISAGNTGFVTGD